MFSKIIVGTDGFGPASKAVAKAVDLAEKSGAELVVVHVQREGHEGPDVLATRKSASVDAGQGLLDDVVKHHGSRVPITTELRRGSPAEVLVDVAGEKSADLIVVGNKGMSKRFHTGSVPNQISHHAPCGVLIVHTVEE